MNIFTASRIVGRFVFEFAFSGGLAFGFGLNAFPHALSFGVSLGPFVLSVTYQQPRHQHTCEGDSCPITPS